VHCSYCNLQMWVPVDVEAGCFLSLQKSIMLKPAALVRNADLFLQHAKGVGAFVVDREFRSAVEDCNPMSQERR